VKLNVEVERRPNGKRYHEVTINDMGSTNLYFKKKVEDYGFEEYIKKVDLMVKDMVDTYEDATNPKTEIEKFLMNQGFN
jgi:hypothetical protein